METKILGKLKEIGFDDLYVLGNIPTSKLNNAISNYPIYPREKILALIDSTVFGSAKTGMAIGLNGIYWKNDWTTDTNKNHLSWEDLKKSIKTIQTKGSDLILAQGCVFGLAGSGAKPEQVKVLLISIMNSFDKDISEGAAAEHKNVTTQENTHTISSKSTQNNNPFAGGYEESLLKVVNKIAKRHRLSQQVYIAPSIKVHKVKTILDICGNNIDPYSILVIIDNTYLQTGKDFLIVTTDAVIAKAMLTKVEQFSLDEIRSISCEESNFSINNYEFQFFDQFSDSEVLVLVDFLTELIPAIRNESKSNQSKNSRPNINSELARQQNSEAINQNSEISSKYINFHVMSLNALRDELKNDGIDLLAEFSYDVLLDKQARLISTRVHLIRHVSKIRASNVSVTEETLDSLSIEVSVLLFLILHFYSLAKLPKSFRDGMGESFYLLHGMVSSYVEQFRDNLSKSLNCNLQFDEESLTAMSSMFLNQDGEGDIKLNSSRDELLVSIMNELSIPNAVSKGLIRDFDLIEADWYAKILILFENES